MKRKEVVFLLCLFIVFPFVSATSTSINIETFANHDIMISALHPGSVYSLIQSFHGKSDANGKFSAIVNTSIPKIDIKVWVKKDNVAVVNERFDGYATGADINLEVYPESYQKPTPTVNTSTSNETVPIAPIDNAVAENTTEIVTETSDSGSKLTGAAVKEGKSSGKTLYYIIGAIVLLGIIGFTSAIVLRRRDFPSNPKDIKVRKLSDIQRERQEMKGKSAEEYKRAYETAQKKIEESQKEINKLKNQEKVKQIEDRIRQQQDEVRRLRRGY